MFAKRLLTLFCGIALFGAVHSSEVSQDSFEMIAGTHEALPSDLVGSLIAAAEEEELAAEEGDEEHLRPYIIQRGLPFYYRRPVARTVVVGANQIPGLMHRFNRLPRRLRWVPAHYPRIVVNPFLARRLLASLYHGKPENIYRVLRALPYPARVALRRLIAHAANPRSYRHICASFLSSYAQVTPQEMSMLQSQEEVAEDAEEEEEVEEENAPPAAPTGAPAVVSANALPAALTAPAGGVKDAAVVSLEKVVSGLEQQAIALEGQVSAMGVKLTASRPNYHLKRNKGPLGRKPTDPSRIVNPDGLHAWDAIAKANTLTGEAGQKPIGSPVPVQHAEYLSVVAFPKE